MKLFHTTTYYINNNKDFKICILSDIHFSTKITNKKMLKITRYLLKLNPDYIFVAGDLLDRLDDVKNKMERKRIIDWLTEISNISKIIIIRGNHDRVKRKKTKYVVDNRNTFFSEVNDIDNIYVLKNSAYEDTNLYVCGIDQNISYYKNNNINLLKKDLLQNKELLEKNTNKKKFLLIHSPVGLDNPDISKLLDNIDYIITGHMHNGCVPPIINEIWRSTRGFISPAKHLLLKNERNTLNKETDKLLVNGPVTTLSKVTKISIFDFVFPLYNTVFEFNNQNKFKVKKRYHLK